VGETMKKSLVVLCASSSIMIAMWSNLHLESGLQMVVLIFAYGVLGTVFGMCASKILFGDKP
jgi:hypothetical protein